MLQLKRKDASAESDYFETVACIICGTPGVARTPADCGTEFQMIDGDSFNYLQLRPVLFHSY